jgi:Leucine-rich repeat (LRR) protein
MRFSLQSRSSSERRSSREGTRACFLAVALFLLGAPLVQAAISTAEHNALVDLYNSTNGASWTNKTNWMVAADECTWLGVECDAGNTTVQAIYIQSNNLSGTLPVSLGSLASLQSLRLAQNHLSGSIPGQLGSLTSLQTLNLDFNQLSGSIPPQLGNLTSLQFLNLISNQLSGSIPAQLGNLISLQDIYLRSNQLSGSIPSALTNLTSLTSGNVDIRWNALYSTDPALTSFLNAKQGGGDWQSTQTIAPANLSTSGATASAITVNWTPIVYAADNGFYQVGYSTTAGGPYTPFATTTSSKSSSSLTVTGLATNTRYYFVVSTTTQPHGNSSSNTVTSGFSAEVSGLTAVVSPPVVKAFTANPSTITDGQSSTLSWTTTSATTVSISGVVGTQASNGAVSVSPTATTIYTLTATGPAGTAAATTTIVVNPAAAHSGSR